jgi:molybdenum cofactor biosynthesis enzyme MoaA
MKRENLIREIIVNMSKLPNQNLIELSNFIDFLMSKNENLQLVEGIQKLSIDSKAFRFIEDEEELYSLEDLKEVYK